MVCNGNRKIYRHVVNAGSVGKTKNGDNKACYTILEIDHNSDLSVPDTVKVHFHFVEYDVRKTVQHIKETGLSDAYDDLLLKQL